MFGYKNENSEQKIENIEYKNEIVINSKEEAIQLLDNLSIAVYNKTKGKSFMLLEGLLGEDTAKLEANKKILQGYLKSISSYVKKVTTEVTSFINKEVG